MIEKPSAIKTAEGKLFHKFLSQNDVSRIYYVAK